MGRTQRGDVEAFGAIYDRYAVRALRMARVISTDDETAERAVHDGFLRAWRRRDSYSQDQEVHTWLLSLMREAANGAVMRNAASGAGPSGTKDPHLTQEDIQVVESLLSRLTPRQRELLADAFLDGLSPIRADESYDAGVPTERIRFGLEPKSKRGVATGDEPEASFEPEADHEAGDDHKPEVDSENAPDLDDLD
jgi:RNA polymerase sigma factor (sigma-70 family)